MALAIRNLAADVDTKLGARASGSVNVTVAAGNNSGDATVAFPAGRFTAAPILIPVVVGTNAFYAIRVASGLTKDSGQVRVVQRDGVAGAATIQVDWVAMQQ